MFSVPRVLICVCDAARKARLRDSLAPYAELRSACSSHEIAERLERERYDAVFCDRALGSSTWFDVVCQIRQISPDLPVIILSQTADEREWMEVLAAGGFDLLSLPGFERTILSVMAHAVASREARSWHSAASLPAA
jgi:two-component system, NtrC family, response regulator HydG